MSTRIFHRLQCSLLWAVVAGLLTAPSIPTNAQSPPPSTLAVALHNLPARFPLGGDLLLVVGAEDVHPISDADLAKARASAQDPSVDAMDIEGVGARYDRSYSVFGHVAAFGPSKMTVLGMPSPFTLTASSVPIGDAMAMLMASFTEDQWRTLGSDGLGIDQLNDEQRAIWDNVVCRPVKLIPGNHPYPEDEENDTSPGTKAYIVAQVPISGEKLHSAKRLHAYFTSNIRFMEKGKLLGVATNWGDAAPRSIAYRLAMSAEAPTGSSPLTHVRDEVHNELKASDLDFNKAALRKDIDIQTAKTVGDVVSVIATATGLELYCDRHYADRSITFVGDAPSRIGADDLLRALDFALAATWRKVGPAYVLTDDLQGVGARRHWIRAAMDPANKGSEALVKQWEGRCDTLPIYQYVRFLPDDTLPIPPELVDKLETSDPGAAFPFTSLAPGTQALLKTKLATDVADVWGPGTDMYPGKLTREEAMSALQRIDQSRPTVRLSLHLSADVDGFGQVALDDGYSFHYYRYKPAVIVPPVADTTATPTVDIRPFRLGAIAAPGSAEEAVRLVDKLADAGMSTLFCEAFYGGETYFPSKVLPPVKPVHADVLSAAVEEGRKRGVAVFGAVHLLRWRSGQERVGDRDWTKLATEDVIVTGQTASQALDGAYRSMSDPRVQQDLAEVDGAWASPSDPRVTSLLTKLVRELVAVKGLAGIAFVDTAAPGYRRDFDRWFAGGIDFGYTEDMRLAYLRRYHQDPIDIDDTDLAFVSSGSMDPSATTTDLHIDSYSPWIQGGENDDDWAEYRKAANEALLSSVYAAAPNLPRLILKDGAFSRWQPGGEGIPEKHSEPEFAVWPYSEFESKGGSLASVLGDRLTSLRAGHPNASPALLVDFTLTPAKTDAVAGVGSIVNVIALPRK